MKPADIKTETRVIIVGVGLIGGSIAAAWRKRFPTSAVIGVGRSRKRLDEAKRAGLLTDFTMELTAEHVSEPCLVVLCLPVNMIADAACSIAAMGGPHVVITDAGSVKGVICDAVRRHPEASQKFVGAHPIAGGENGGFEFADSDLFQGRACVVVRDNDNEAMSGNLQRVALFWKEIGCRVRFMTAIDHDYALALTSHLPHVMAAVTATTVGADLMPLCGAGFRDSTRIAAGNASLWRAILAGNRDQVSCAIQAAEQVLRDFRTALESADDERLELLLAAAAQRRSELDV